MTLAVIAGALVLLGGVVWAAVLVVGGVNDLADSGPRYELTTPKTLVGDAYTLQTGNAAVDEQRESLQDGLHSGNTAVLAHYARGDDVSRGGLVISGFYGDIVASDATMRDGMLDGLERGSGTRVVKERRDLRPQGEDGLVVTCAAIELKQPGGTSYSPACAWSDGSTAANVMWIEPEYTSAADVDLAEYARETVQVRREVTVPAG